MHVISNKSNRQQNVVTAQLPMFQIEAARINSGYTRQEVADELGITLNAYNRCIAGKTPMRNERIIALAAIFNLSKHQIIIPKLSQKNTE